LEPGRDRQLVTAALVLAMVLAALEATAVGTAMPTVVAELGGVSRYSWVFSAYLLTSTTTVPLYGKLADLFGRRRVFAVAVGLFLGGAALCGTATSFAQLIVYRAIQGLGAGGVMPVAITVIADIYTLRERGKMQGLFSATWAVSSLVGPLAGGLITDLLSWRWIFYINVPFGAASMVILHLFLREEAPRKGHRLDLAGTLTLIVSVSLLLVALLEGSQLWGWGDWRTQAMLGGAALGLAAFVAQERRTPEPTLPVDLFRVRVIAVSVVGSALLGTILFCVSAYVPVFSQGVLGGTAIDAGMTLVPLSLGWPVAATLAGWLLYRFGYRPFAVLGAALAAAGCGLLASASAGGGVRPVMLAMLLVGLGLGFMSTPYLLAVQNAVPWNRRGVATGTVQFFRTIGGAIAVAALGAVLNAHLRAGVGPGVDVNVALHPEARTEVSPALLGDVVRALESGLGSIYTVMAVIAVAGVFVALLFPAGPAALHAHEEARGPAGPTPPSGSPV
jgi:EmrB/QacA subfamily drug resistance transporter